MFGHNSTLVLEYSWDPQNIPPPKSEITDIIKTEPESEPVIPPPALDLSEPLSKLLSVAKLHYRKNIIKCPCGHVCGNKTNAQLKKDVETKIRKILTDIDKCTDENEEKVTTVFHNGDNGGTFITPPVYLPPKIPINPYFQANTMQLASQIASIQRLTPRYCNRKGWYYSIISFKKKLILFLLMIESLFLNFEMVVRFFTDTIIYNFFPSLN